MLEINEALVDDPKLINNAPLDAWIIKVKINDPEELKSLMDEAAYSDFCAKQH